jgi:hypothetical protein
MKNVTCKISREMEVVLNRGNSSIKDDEVMIFQFTYISLCLNKLNHMKSKKYLFILSPYFDKNQTQKLVAICFFFFFS